MKPLQKCMKYHNEQASQFLYVYYKDNKTNGIARENNGQKKMESNNEDVFGSTPPNSYIYYNLGVS
jgi:hypothetical protein